MTLKTQHDSVIYHTPALVATPILFYPKLIEAISLQKNKIYFNQRK